MIGLVMPALVSRSARDEAVGGPFGAGSAGFWGSTAVTRMLSLAAVGELIGDKLPFTPNRTEPLSLAARAASGAMTAAAFAKWRGRPAMPATVLAAVSAIASAHLMIRLRKVASRRLPDPIVAAAEDCLALALGHTVVLTALRSPVLVVGPRDA
jgi:uncharacterized membrane protein